MAVNFSPGEPHFLDTSAVILMLRAGIKASSGALLPFAVRGELLIGAYRSVNSAREGAKLQAALENIPVIYPTRDTVVSYARAAARLQPIGRLIPTNDLWIAALALEWELPLLTADAHFVRVSGLKLLPLR